MFALLPTDVPVPLNIPCKYFCCKIHFIAICFCVVSLRYVAMQLRHVFHICSGSPCYGLLQYRNKKEWSVLLLHSMVQGINSAYIPSFPLTENCQHNTYLYSITVLNEKLSIQVIFKQAKNLIIKI
jgi:hypothetical protein